MVTIEIINNFICTKCSNWFSIAKEIQDIEQETFICPWCGHSEKHKIVTYENKND